MDFYKYKNNDNTEPFCVIRCSSYEEYVEACEIFNREPSSSMHNDYENCNFLVGRAFSEHTFHCTDSDQENDVDFEKALFITMEEYKLNQKVTDIYELFGMDKHS